MDWQPIKTAPKDKMVWLYTPGSHGGIGVGRWNGERDEWSALIGGPGLVLVEDAGANWRRVFPSPSQWAELPIPAPPSQ